MLVQYVTNLTIRHKITAQPNLATLLVLMVVYVSFIQLLLLRSCRSRIVLFGQAFVPGLGLALLSLLPIELSL